MRPAFLLLLAVSSAAFAQDERRLSSPDGQLEFRLFIASQQDTALSRLAYQVFHKGKCIVEQSFLGLDIWEQEPLLGENDGLMDAPVRKSSEFHTMTASYMQNGSTGRSLDIEVRAYNDGVAFRYIVPRSNMLEEVRLADDTTEFAVVESAGVRVTEVRDAHFPAMRLEPQTGGVLLARLEHKLKNPAIAFEGLAPLVCPWRVVILNSSGENKLLSSLAR